MQQQQSARLEQVNIHQLMEKISSKKDVFNFLTQECEAYLPKLDTVNIFFLKQITRGTKDVSLLILTQQYIKRSAVKVAAVPQIEGLTVEDFLTHARKKAPLLKYLPDENDWKHLDKKWVCDVLYTQDTQAIQDMINKAMTARRKKLEQNQNLMVEMRPEFAQALKRCESFSSKTSPLLNLFVGSKGKAAFLLKPSSKKKRSREELEEVK